MKRVNRHGQRQRGVALFEVLLAVMLFSLGCLAIAGAMDAVFTAESIIREQETMARVADNEMKVLLANPTNPPETASREEDIDGVEYQISHQAEIRLLEREDHPSVRMYDIQILVKQGEREASLRFWKHPNG